MINMATDIVSLTPNGFPPVLTDAMILLKNITYSLVIRNKRIHKIVFVNLNNVFKNNLR